MATIMKNWGKMRRARRLELLARTTGHRLKARAALAVVVALVAVGCDGGSVSVETSWPDYTGTFRLAYSIVTDECGLLAEDSSAFGDVHRITQNADVVTISSDEGFLLNVSAVIDENGDFVARENYVIEEPGFAPCDVDSALSYQNPTNGRPASADQESTEVVLNAESVFVFRLNCSDGFVCESRALGYAERAEDDA